jgi:hypothetical protein
MLILRHPEGKRLKRYDFSIGPSDLLPRHLPCANLEFCAAKPAGVGASTRFKRLQGRSTQPVIVLTLA